MRLMVQKVISGSITVENVTIASIGVGLFVLVGFYRDDTDKEIDYLVRRLLRLRLFPDDDGRRWQVNIMEKDYEILCNSQITLHYTIKGHKIDFHTSMHPNNSRAFYEQFITKLRLAYKFEKVQTGQFASHSHINIINDGPVSFQLEYPKPKTKDIDNSIT